MLRLTVSAKDKATNSVQCCFLKPHWYGVPHYTETIPPKRLNIRRKPQNSNTVLCQETPFESHVWEGYFATDQVAGKKKGACQVCSENHDIWNCDVLRKEVFKRSGYWKSNQNPLSDKETSLNQPNFSWLEQANKAHAGTPNRQKWWRPHTRTSKERTHQEGGCWH